MADQGPAVEPCDCPDYTPNVELIDGALSFIALRSGGPGYTGKRLVYCPWCGTKLKLAYPDEVRDG